MADGIIKRHSVGCPGRNDGRCKCNAGYEASVYIARDKRKLRRNFPRLSEAKSWRSEALAAAKAGKLRRAVREDRRTLYEAVAAFVEGMAEGKVRPKGRDGYKPNTVRSYERAVRLYLRDSELGGLRPADVRRSDVQAYAEELLARISAPSVGTL